MQEFNIPWHKISYLNSNESVKALKHEIKKLILTTISFAIRQCQ